MWIRNIFLMLTGLSSGLLVSFGVFTALFVIGLIPRFAGKTHTANKIILYEECVILGTLIGGILSIFYKKIHIYAILSQNGQFFWLLVSGIFAGTFVGCLALAIGEMLNTIPIFARRIGYRHGIGLAITSMALGKFAGSMYFFIMGFGK